MQYGNSPNAATAFGEESIDLQILGGVDLHAGAHGGHDGAGLDILALGGGRLGLDDGAHESVEVLGELQESAAFAEEYARYQARYAFPEDQK